MRHRLLLSGLLSLFWSPVLLAAPVARPLEWKLGGDTFSGYLVYDDSVTQPRPGLVMVPNWKGVNESAIEKARLVAGDDYVVLVADVYGKGIRPKTDAEAAPVATAMRAPPRRSSSPPTPPCTSGWKRTWTSTAGSCSTAN